MRLPLESYPLQALVSEPVKPIFPCVVMSNTIHAYISQSDKGELVIGAGTDAYTSYTQRGGLHINSHTLEAICELFPMFRRMRMLRNWGGIVDVSPDRSPIIAQDARARPVRQLRLGHGRIQGHPGIARTSSPGRSPATSRIRSTRRSRSSASAKGGSSTRRRPPPWRIEQHSSVMLLIDCPYCGVRPELEFVYGGQAHIARPAQPRGVQRRAVGRIPLLARERQGSPRRALAPHTRLRSILQRAARHHQRSLPRHLSGGRAAAGGGTRGAPQDRRHERRLRDGERRPHRPRAGRSVSDSTTATTPASPAIRWPRRCSPTACTCSGARSNTIGRAAFSPPDRRSRTRSSPCAGTRPG